MNVSSVKNPSTQPSPPTKHVTEAPKHAAQAKPSELKQPRQAQAMPVVNSQGQTTGRHLNVTA